MVDRGIEIKRHPEKWYDALAHKTLAMIFQKTSTRTRFSFEVGIQQMGGNALFVPSQYTQFSIADIRDETKVISRYVDLIMARMRKNGDLIQMAEGSEVPVINGCDDRYHPAQALTDLMTIKEMLGRTEGVRVVYFGVGNNVSNSLSLATILAGGHFTLCAPEVDPDAVDEDLLDRLHNSGQYEENRDPASAVKNADVVYTDTWINMEYFEDPAYAEVKEQRIKLMQPYQLTESLVEQSGKEETLIMHCLPAHKGFEVNDSVIYHENSVVFDQAENRMHAQKALMLWLLGKLD